MKLEVGDLRDFCTHPFWLVLDVDRERTSDHPIAKYSFAGDFPFPGKHWSHHIDHYQGPWIKEDATWKDFRADFFIEVDDHTLRSWKGYQRQVDPTLHPDQHIVYSINLPPVPSYPDKRTVLVNGDQVIVEKQVTSDLNAPNTGLSLTKAIVPGVRRASTMSLALQALPTSMARNNSLPSVHSNNGINPPSVKKKSTFVTETFIPPMSSMIQAPVSSLLSADPSVDSKVPSVPLLQRLGTEPVAREFGTSSGGNQQQPSNGTDDNAVDGVSRPLLARVQSRDSDP